MLILLDGGLPASFGESQHCAPVLFRRAARTVKFRGPFELKLRRRQFSPPDTFFRFLIQKLRFRSRAAKLCQAFHDYRRFIRAAPDAQFVAETHDPTWLRAGAVDVNLPAGDGVCGEGTGLEEACRPEPFVDTNRLAAFFNLFV